jgi:5-methylcytosine-specific restriction enzyme subunit McrC
VRTIQLHEYQTQRKLALSRDEVRSLRDTFASIRIEPSTIGGHFDVTPGHDVGACNLPGLSVQVHPKIGIRNLLFLIAYAIDPASWRGVPFDYGEDKYLTEALVPGFTHAVESAIRRGLLEQYVSVEAALPLVRGRIRFSDQLRRRFLRFPPAELRFDEFTADIEENQVLKAALQRAAGLTRRSDWAKRLVRALEPAFSAVTSKSYERQLLPRFQFTRLNEHYRTAIQLALLLLRGYSLEMRTGRITAESLVVNMNEVFENFVVIGLREQLGLSASVFPQRGSGRRLFLDAEERVRLKPDLSWWERGNCLFVGDVKYKRLQLPGMKHPDIYQALAYAIAADLPVASLVYPSSEVTSGVYSIPTAGRRIEVHTLNVAAEPQQVLEQITSLAQRVKALKEGGRAHRPLTIHAADRQHLELAADPAPTSRRATRTSHS